MMSGRNRNRCLIAGGAGFVGANLSRYLLDHGAEVDCVDNLSTGRLANVADLRRRPGFNFIDLDVTDGDGCERLLRRRYTHVYHLACPTGVPNIALMGDQMLLASSIGTFNLLKIARRSGAKFLFTSTAEVYGDPQVFPQAETYPGNVDPVGPRSAYEEGKRFGEAMTRFLGRKYEIDAFVVRIFNTYGPGMSPSDQRVIPQMLSSMIEGKPVRIFGDGSQNRTFLHIEDLIGGLTAVMDRGEPGEVYNVGGSEQVTIRQLFQLVRSVTGLKATAKLTKHFIADHRGRCPDTSKVEALGWRQNVSLADGIRESYVRFLEELAPSTLSAGRPDGREIIAPAVHIGRMPPNVLPPEQIGA